MLSALSSAVIVVSMVASDWKPVPLTVVRPRPAESKVTPVMVSELVPVSLNTTLRLSPFSRLMPL